METERTLPSVPPAAAGAPDGLDPASRRHRAAAALLAAVALGVLGDLLLKTTEVGVNLPLWCLAAVGAAILLGARRGGGIAPASWAFGGAVVFFAGVLAWRETDGLIALSLLSMLTAFGLLAFSLARWPEDLVGAPVARYFAAAFGLGLSAAFGTLMLVASDGALARTDRPERGRRVWPIVRGVVIAVPILFVFAELLGAADPRFAAFLTRLIDIDLAETIGHLLFAGFIAWVAAGYLRAATVSREPLGVPEGALRGGGFRVGATELVIPLVLLDLLFVAFIVFQVPYLFGGADHLRTAAGLTAAEYARRGFFELVAVAALLLPLLLLANALLRRDASREVRAFRVAALVTIGLLGVIMVSALQRMRLYTIHFGLTSSRIFATAAMVWLAIVFALFAVTLLRERPRWFVLGSIVAGWAIVAALTILNPDALVVRTNVARGVDGRTVDAAYLARLSADAAPALAAALPRLDAATRCQVVHALAARGTRRARGLPEDWRWWNASATRAFAIGRQVSDEARACGPAATAPPAPMPR